MKRLFSIIVISTLWAQLALAGGTAQVGRRVGSGVSCDPNTENCDLQSGTTVDGDPILTGPYDFSDADDLGVTGGLLDESVDCTAADSSIVCTADLAPYDADDSDTIVSGTTDCTEVGQIDVNVTTGVYNVCTNATSNTWVAMPGIQSICHEEHTIATGLLNSDDLKGVWRAPTAGRIVGVHCKTSAGTATLDIQIDDGSPADVMGADLTCATTAVSDTSSLTGTLAAGNWIDWAVTSVASTPIDVSVCFDFASN